MSTASHSSPLMPAIYDTPFADPVLFFMHGTHVRVLQTFERNGDDMVKIVCLWSGVVRDVMTDALSCGSLGSFWSGITAGAGSSDVERDTFRRFRCDRERV